MKLAFVYLGGRLARLASGADVPTDFFLGARELQQRGHQVTLHEARDSEKPGMLEIAFRLLVRQAFLPPKTYIGLFAGLRGLAHQLRDREVVVGTSSGIAFVLTFWKWWDRLPFEVVGIHNGILHFRLSILNRWTAVFLLRRMFTQLYARPEMEAMQRRFHVPAARIEANPFGVDVSFWSPGGERATPAFVLAVGSDPQRDWETLMEAARGATWRLVLITRQPLPSSLPPTVEHRRGSYAAPDLSDAALRDAYRAATCVVIPLKPGIQPSGQSVTLQAMACGTPVVLTQTEGLWDADGLKAGERVRLVPPGDPVALRRAIDAVLTDPTERERLAHRGRPYVLAQGNSTAFADRVEKLCVRVVGKRAVGADGENG